MSTNGLRSCLFAMVLGAAMWVLVIWGITRAYQAFVV